LPNNTDIVHYGPGACREKEGARMKIDLAILEQQLERTVRRARERDIIAPTFQQMIDPAKVPAKIREELAGIGLWDIHPRNLFRITWKNEAVARGGGFGFVN
jgi:cysteine synthase A